MAYAIEQYKESAGHVSCINEKLQQIYLRYC